MASKAKSSSAVSEICKKLLEGELSEEEEQEIIRHYTSDKLLKNLNDRLKSGEIEKVIKVPREIVNDDGTIGFNIENKLLFDVMTEFFEKYFIKSTGKTLPDTPGARRERSTSFSAPGFLFELEAKLKEEGHIKRGDRSNFVTKAWGIYLMTNFPQEWEELYNEYEPNN
jgi:hypothetical protein